MIELNRRRLRGIGDYTRRGVTVVDADEADVFASFVFEACY